MSRQIMADEHNHFLLLPFVEGMKIGYLQHESAYIPTITDSGSDDDHTPLVAPILPLKKRQKKWHYFITQWFQFNTQQSPVRGDLPAPFPLIRERLEELLHCNAASTSTSLTPASLIEQAAKQQWHRHIKRTSDKLWKSLTPSSFLKKFWRGITFWRRHDFDELHQRLEEVDKKILQRLEKLGQNTPAMVELARRTFGYHLGNKLVTAPKTSTKYLDQLIQSSRANSQRDEDSPAHSDTEESTEPEEAIGVGNISAKDSPESSDVELESPPSETQLEPDVMSGPQRSITEMATALVQRAPIAHDQTLAVRAPALSAEAIMTDPKYIFGQDAFELALFSCDARIALWGEWHTTKEAVEAAAKPHYDTINEKKRYFALQKYHPDKVTDTPLAPYCGLIQAKINEVKEELAAEIERLSQLSEVTYNAQKERRIAELEFEKERTDTNMIRLSNDQSSKYCRAALDELIRRYQAYEAARRADQEEARRNQEEARRNQEEARRNQEEARRSQEEARRNQEEARRNQEVMSTQMGTLTTQVASLTQKLAKSERTTQILLARLLAKEGIDATVPEEDEAETARHEPTTSSSSPAANPHSLFVGSQQPVTTAPADASHDESVTQHAEITRISYSS